jgi:hypothetical protein
MTSRFILHVPRHWLLLVAGILWFAVGLLLCGRAVQWSIDARTGWLVLLDSLGVILALVAYVGGFHKVVRRNIERVLALEARAPVYAFTGLRGYTMISLMVATGIVLRNSPLDKLYLVLPYMTMGGVLIRGSLDYVRRFLELSRIESI